MRTASRLLIASIASLSFSGLALAQDAPAGDAPAGGDATAPAPDPAAAAPAPTPDAGGAVSGAWSRSIIDRPLTLPKGLLAIGADLETSTKHFFDPAAIRLGVGYGITDDFDINLANYAFLSSDAGKGTLGADVGYKLVRGAAGGKLEAIARANIGYSLVDGAGLVPLGLGVHVQYKVTPKIAIFSGGPGNEQLTIGLKDVHPIVLSIPVGVLFQATPELIVAAQTNLTDLVLSDDSTGIKSTYIFSDTTPLQITATYVAMPALDIYAGLAMDLTPPAGGVGDTLAVVAGARFYVGDAVKAGAGAPAPAAM